MQAHSLWKASGYAIPETFQMLLVGESTPVRAAHKHAPRMKGAGCGRGLLQHLLHLVTFGQIGTLHSSGRTGLTSLYMHACL